MTPPETSRGSLARATSTRAASAAPASTSPEAMTDLFPLLAEHEHEQVSCWYEPSTGYRGLIAIHDTTLGPAMGGTRFWNYASAREALVAARRRSPGMPS